MEHKIQANSKHKLLFLIFILFSFLLITSYITIDKVFFGNKAQNVALNNAVKKTKERSNVLKSFLKVSENTLYSLRELDSFKNYLTSKQSTPTMLNTLYIFTKANKDIMQLRYLDKNGMEKIRIDKDTPNSNPIIKDKNSFQDKSSRYYFTNSKTFTQEKVWFSALDLNKEFGKIEIPFKPTIRAILPIFTNKEFEGVLIINYFMANFLKTFTNAPLYDMILCDHQGYNLYHFNHKKSWGYFKKEKHNIKDDFPNNSKIILTEDLVQTEKFVSRKLDLPLFEPVTLILQLNNKYLQKQEKQIFKQYLIVSISSFILSLVLAYLVVRIFSRTLLNLTVLREKESEINNLVIELQTINNSLKEKVREEVEKNKTHEKVIFEQSKQAQMGDMIGNIAHQWRQPLSVISTASTGLLMEKTLGTLNDEKFDSNLRLINEQTQYLSNTIETFRNYIMKNKKYTTVILQERITQAIQVVHAMLNSHHIKLIDNTSTQEPIEIKLVIGELLEVIINLINNSKDVLIEREIEDPYIKIDLQQEQKYAIVTIEDNGGGIDDNVLPRIFEPYFTTKHQSIGTGLGLYMSKKTIEESLHGELLVNNEPKGACFTIKLPLEKLD